MYMNLKCPRCGFSFGIAMPHDEPEESKRELMTCPCGVMMEEMETLETNILNGGVEHGN